MPTQADVQYFDDTEWAAEEVSATQIDQCADPDQLQKWLTSFETLSDFIKADFEAFSFTRSAAPEWTHRVSQKLAFLGRGCSRIKRRLRALGVFDPQAAHIQKLESKLAFLKAAGAHNAAFVEAARVLLDQGYCTELHARAERAVASAEGSISTRAA